MAQKNTYWTVLSMLDWGTDYFEKKAVNNARLSIEWILAFVLDVKRLDLYLAFDRPLTSTELDAIRPMVKRRSEHEPLQYITGQTDFIRAKIDVNEHVLIPRPETEQLVDLILSEYDGSTKKTVLDIGTGSGCIPISIKMDRLQWSVSGIDISEQAIMQAQKNAQKNNVEIDFRTADLFQLAQSDHDLSYDIIISNPPYVLEYEKELLDKEVVDFEPHLALFCKSTENMYSAIEKIALESLAQDGVLYLEIHHSQASKVLEIFSSSLWQSTVLKDYDNNDRFVTCRRNNS